MKSNFKTMFDNDMSCRNCSVNNTYEDEKHIFEECSVFCTERTEWSNVKYEHIFGTLEQHIKYHTAQLGLISRGGLIWITHFLTSKIVAASNIERCLKVIKNIFFLQI